VATTVYAQRCACLKERHERNRDSKEPKFIVQFNNLWALANLGRLSRMNCIWLGKRIHAMVETWTEPDQREMLDRLQERQARAWKRWEKRIAEYAAAKQAGKRGRKQQPITPAQEPPSPSIDPWEA
jgi:hypothetical protein